MPRITITVSESTLSAMDDFALHVGKSRSVVCASVLDMVVPMLGYLKTTYDLAKSGDTEGMQTFVGSIGDLLQDVSGQYESLLGGFAEPAEGVNPVPVITGVRSHRMTTYMTRNAVFLLKKVA